VERFEGGHGRFRGKEGEGTQVLLVRSIPSELALVLSLLRFGTATSSAKTRERAATVSDSCQITRTHDDRCRPRSRAETACFLDEGRRRAIETTARQNCHAGGRGLNPRQWITGRARRCGMLGSPSALGPHFSPSTRRPQVRNAPRSLRGRLSARREDYLQNPAFRTVGQASPDGPSTPRERDPAEDSTEDSTPPRVEHRLLEPYGMAEPNLHRR